MTEIKIVKNLLTDGVTRFDLVGKDLPEQFLGLAFDLKLNGNWLKTVYQKTEFGEVLRNLMVEPIKMAKFEGGVLIAGMTFKADQVTHLKDGVLLSFYFAGGEVEAEGVERQVLSIFDRYRRDLSANWLIENRSELVATKLPLKLAAKPSNVPGDSMVALVDLGRELETDLMTLPTEWQQIMEKPVQVSESSWMDWWIWLVVVLIVVIFGLTIGKVRLNSTR